MFSTTIHATDDFSLLPYQHLTCRGEVACGQRVEIDTTRHGFTERVFPIPIRRTRTILIYPRRLVSEGQLPNHLTIHGIDMQCNIGLFCQLIRYPFETSKIC